MNFFGSTVRWIGDGEGDTIDDLAIPDPLNQRVLIYKGRAVWPSMLSDLQFDYQVTADPTYAGSAFGSTIAGIGDFDGDGIDDFAIGANGFSGNSGHLD